MEVDEATLFARVTEGLLGVGAASLAQYLCDPFFTQNLPSGSAPALQLPQPITAAPEKVHMIPKAVARLHEACQATFGNTLALTFDFEGNENTHGTRCTLTITRPNGAKRTFTSTTTYGRKYDAKASACSIAIEKGAIDFILSESDGAGPSDPPLEMDESVKAIEQCCLERGSGRVKPFWLNINEPRFGRTQGCALRIRLGPHNSRVYSVNTVYNSPAEARKACAEAALAEGVIDYIKTWSSPTTVTDYEVEETDPPTPISLQRFLESLPQPLPEAVVGKTAIDINALSWLNTTIQSAKGGKIVPNFVWTTDPRYGLHGCLLRLERPGDVKSYLVDARFSKRMEAKSAVCLLAMTQGLGDYIRSVGKAVEDKIPLSMRKYASEVLLPTLLAEYRRVRGPGIQPTFEYDVDHDACGATLLIELAPASSSQQTQKYSVPAEYRSRNDAKLAVVLRAAEQGAIEFLRFGGKPTPPGYVPHYTQQDRFVNRKRKHSEYSIGGEWSGPSGYNGNGAAHGGAWQSMKPRVGGFQGNLPGSSHVQGGIHGPGHRGQFMPGGYTGDGSAGDSKAGWHGQQKSSNALWKGYHVPGFGPVGDAHFATGQYKPGPRNVGAPIRTPLQYYPLPASLPVPYVGNAMQPHPQQNIPASSSPYPHPVGGTVAGVQPPPAGYYGAVPQDQVQGLFQGGISQAPQSVPYGMPNTVVPGGYPSYFPVQPHVPAPVQYPAQYPYSLAAVPGQGQAPAYPPYLPAHPQPPFFPPAASPPVASRPAVFVPTAAPASVLSPVPPYSATRVPAVAPTNSPATPAMNPPVPMYQPPSASQQPGPPLPSQPPQPLPPPVVPPPPPAVSAPPLPPTPSAASNVTSSKSSKAQTPSTPLYAGSGDGKKAAKVSIPIESTRKTSVTALHDYCTKNNLPTPQWSHEITKGQPKERELKHKVWVVIGKMKFELPVTFTSLYQGQEKIAKKVLDQLQLQAAAKAAKP